MLRASEGLRSFATAVRGLIAFLIWLFSGGGADELGLWMRCAVALPADFYQEYEAGSTNDHLRRRYSIATTSAFAIAVTPAYTNSQERQARSRFA